MKSPKKSTITENSQAALKDAACGATSPCPTTWRVCLHLWWYVCPHTLHKQVGWGQMALGGGRLEVVDHPDSSCATVSPRDTQMVLSLHWALEIPGKQGKLSFATCKDLGAESQNQPNSKMLWWERVTVCCSVTSSTCTSTGKTMPTGLVALGQGSQCSGFSRNCLFSQSSSPNAAGLQAGAPVEAAEWP